MSYLDELTRRSAPTRQVYDDDDDDDADSGQCLVDPRVPLDVKVTTAPNDLQAPSHLLVASSDIASAVLQAWIESRGKELGARQVATVPVTFRRPFGVHVDDDDEVTREICLWRLDKDGAAVILAPVHVPHLPMELHTPVKNALLSHVKYQRMTVVDTQPLSAYRAPSDEAVPVDRTLLVRHMHHGSAHAPSSSPLKAPNTVSGIGAACFSDAVHQPTVSATLYAVYVPSVLGGPDLSEAVPALSDLVSSVVGDKATAGQTKDLQARTQRLLGVGGLSTSHSLFV
ncbi:hypothetical protein RI367_002571 [Sorochytrium milnesiophthora]